MRLFTRLLDVPAHGSARATLKRVPMVVNPSHVSAAWRCPQAWHIEGTPEIVSDTTWLLLAGYPAAVLVEESFEKTWDQLVRDDD